MEFDKIPGGAQLNSKRMYNYSPNYPMYYDRAKGIYISTNEKTYIDMSTMGIGCAILGYSNDAVDQAVVDDICKCTMTSLNSKIEIDLAIKLMEIHPYFDMVRYFKCGGEALAAAVRIARCANKWGKVISIGYHGWHDWYLAGNLRNENNITSHLNITTHNGILEGLIGTNVFCNHNDHKMLLEILQNGKHEFDAIVFEYARYSKPTEEFLKVIKSAQDKGIIIIADEITTGWRYRFGGMHKDYTDILTPDVIVYGKAISNGYPFSCVIGTKSVMKYFIDTFISSTYWTESIGMAAALATIKELEKADYHKRNQLQESLESRLKEKLNAQLSGISGLLHYIIPGMTIREWCEKMLEKEYLVTDNIYLSFDHCEKSIDDFCEAI